MCAVTSDHSVSAVGLDVATSGRAERKYGTCATSSTIEGMVPLPPNTGEEERRRAVSLPPLVRDNEHRLFTSLPHAMNWNNYARLRSAR